MAIKFANNVSTYLATGINSTQTSIDVTSTVGLPVLSAGDYFYATIYMNVGVVEIIKVTSVSGGTLTCLRGQDNSPASSWAPNTRVDLRLTAAGLYESGVASNGMFQNAIVITTDETVAIGYNAISGGPITINPGVTVTVSTGSTWSIV